MRSLSGMLSALLLFSLPGAAGPVTQAPISQRPPVALPPQSPALQAGPAPTNVTLTPASAINLTVAWSPAAGAVRYLISRNGAPDIVVDPNAGFLQGNRYVYTDVGRRPATIQSYSVTAQFPAPTLPSRSSVARILMPTAFAPANVRATVSGPGAVTLVWDGRPEATGYKVIRNGGNLPAAGFNVPGLLFVDQNLPAGTYTYVVQSVSHLASGEDYGSEFSVPVTVKARPFNVLAIGDSVMWGQGLQQADKFSYKTRDWIQGQLGIPVSLNVKAHSGAITYPDPGYESYENLSYDGEVPTSFPTISHQIDLAGSGGPNQPAAADVDLVLVDGCVNNIQVINVILPAPDDGPLGSGIQGYCNQGMINILRKTVQTFPNADVILTSYFRFISMSSDLRMVLPLFGALGQVIPPDPLSTAVGANLNPFQLRSAARSDFFYQNSNLALQAAVATANSSAVPGRTRFNQIRYAQLNPTLDNSYAAPASWQWLMPAPPLYQDAVYPSRHNACDQAAHGPHDPSLGMTSMCYEASLGHPNVAGAQAYTNTITATAAPLIPQWRAAHVGPVLAGADTIAIGAQLGPDAPDGGTLVVTALDVRSNTQLAGTLQFNGVNSGPLGTSLRYGYLATNPTDILVTVLPQGRTPRNFLIPVRTFATSVSVANGAMIVAAADTVTGRPLAGTVSLTPGVPGSVTGQTGQPISVSACPPTKYHIVPAAGGTQIPCGGVVHVPYYPDARF